MSNWPTWEESRRRRDRAIELRKQGLSYSEIQAMVGGSSASMSLWLRDVAVPPQHRDRIRSIRAQARQKSGATLRQRRLDKEARIRSEAASEVWRLTDRELFIAGVIAYAAEGCKQKPWQRCAETKFINSDPRMIQLFLRWCDLLGIDRSELKFRVSIHETADVQAAVGFWARLVGIPVEAFQRSTLKRGNPKTKRRNVSDGYHGCLIVGVRRSSDLTRRIEGWFDAVVRASAEPIPSESPTPRPTLGAAR